MDYSVRERNRHLAEEFLQDLLFQAKNAEEMKVLMTILLEMQRVSEQPERTKSVAVPREQADSRFEILKVCPNGSVSIGAIQGFEHAKRVLVCLNTTENGLYFLYDRNACRVVEPSICSIDEANGTIFFN